jgi:hypothetical protein
MLPPPTPSTRGGSVLARGHLEMGMPRRRPTVDISHKHGTLVFALEGEI